MGNLLLSQHGRRWLDEMLTHGVTTIEAKSGYGLDRETELVQLRVTDLDLSVGVLTAFGKGSKERPVPVGRTAVQWVSRYLQVGRPTLAGGETSELLFVRRGARGKIGRAHV